MANQKNIFLKNPKYVYPTIAYISPFIIKKKEKKIDGCIYYLFCASKNFDRIFS